MIYSYKTYFFSSGGCALLISFSPRKDVSYKRTRKFNAQQHTSTKWSVIYSVSTPDSRIIDIPLAPISAQTCLEYLSSGVTGVKTPVRRRWQWSLTSRYRLIPGYLHEAHRHFRSCLVFVQRHESVKVNDSTFRTQLAGCSALSRAYL